MYASPCPKEVITRKLLPEHRRNVLEVIIRRELIRQKAAELGLEANPVYQETLRRMQAQIDAFKREKLPELYWRRLAAKAEVRDAEAQDYFTENAKRIRSEHHIWQILLRDESSIMQSLSEIERGASFEQAARKTFPNLTNTAMKPWDLGYLRWTQVPESWQSVVDDLKIGEVSGVIRGPNNRFWIIKLIDRREDTSITFESMKPVIMAQLKNAKIEQQREIGLPRSSGQRQHLIRGTGRSGCQCQPSSPDLAAIG